jgi:hypothetical protein
VRLWIFKLCNKNTYRESFRSRNRIKEREKTEELECDQLKPLKGGSDRRIRLAKNGLIRLPEMGASGDVHHREKVYLKLCHVAGAMLGIGKLRTMV